MTFLRPRLILALAALAAVAGAAALHFGASAQAGEKTAATSSHGLILGSADSSQPQNMEQFLTAVTQDVDSYWTKVFADEGLGEPRVSYAWIPAGQTAASARGDDSGTLGDSAAAYCP